MATCSNMADPVLLFQLPEMDVRLQLEEQIDCKKLWRTSTVTFTNNKHREGGFRQSEAEKFQFQLWPETLDLVVNAT